MLSKHPQRAKLADPNPENVNCFFVTHFDLYKAIISVTNGSVAGPDIQIRYAKNFVIHFDLYKAIISVTNGSVAGPDKIVPQIFKDLVSKFNGSAGLIFLKSLTKLINLIRNGKIPVPLRPFLPQTLLTS